MKCLKLIEDYYGDKVAKRSNVKLINHIYEGLNLLDYLRANDIVKGAYCLHPILQSDEDFNKNKYLISGDLVSEAILAMEYRRVANSYLSFNKISEFVGFSCPEIKQMLIADKVQNYKDFITYHYEKHDRSQELNKYFNNWFKLLEIDYNKYKEYL